MATVFCERCKIVLGPEEVERSLKRLAYEVVEKNRGTKDLIIIPLVKGGLRFGYQIKSYISEIENTELPVAELDISQYRDDLPKRTGPELIDSVDKISGFSVVLVDDVLYTGRTVRAALEALNRLGRPKKVYLAVMIDRGHREIPVRPDFVGKNLPTSRNEFVLAQLEGISICRTNHKLGVV